MYRRGRISEYADKFKSAVYTPFDPNLDHNPLWNHKAQCAFPSATQNEINGKDAANMLRNGVYVVSEGANMPTTIGGREPISRRRDSLRSGQSRQCRRRRHLRARDGAKQHAHFLDARRSR